MFVMETTNVQPPARKGKYTSKENTTHMRIFKVSHIGLKALTTRWNTSQIEAIRYLVDLANTGAVDPPADPDA